MSDPGLLLPRNWFLPPSPLEQREAPKPAPTVLPAISEIRKTIPIATGCVDYFPAALAAVAELSHWGNEKHNAGEPLHDARNKSGDDADCLMRHFLERGKEDTIVVQGKQIKVRHSTCVAWRALRLLQRELESDGAPVAPGARFE